MIKVVRQISSRRARATISALAGLLVAGILLRAMMGGGGEIGRSFALLSHPGELWVGLALLCEVASYLAYAAAQHGLVRAAGRRLRIGWLACLAVSAQALTNFFPAGYVAANVLNFRELRRRELDPAQSGWILLMSSVLYIGTLACLTAIGSQIAAHTTGAFQGLSFAALALTALLMLAFLVLARRGMATGLLRRGLPHLIRHLPGEHLHWEGRARDCARRLSEVRLTRRGAAVAAVLFAASWAADAACLVLSFRAVGAPPPWSSLLLAYCGAQLVSFLPITPGGLGLVEGSLAAALMAGGAGGIHVLSAVLLYRVISYWGTLPAGALGYAVIRRTAPATGSGLAVGSGEWAAPTISAAPSST